MTTTTATVRTTFTHADLRGPRIVAHVNGRQRSYPYDHALGATRAHLQAATDAATAILGTDVTVRVGIAHLRGPVPNGENHYFTATTIDYSHDEDERHPDDVHCVIDSCACGGTEHDRDDDAGDHAEDPYGLDADVPGFLATYAE